MCSNQHNFVKMAFRTAIIIFSVIYAHKIYMFQQNNRFSINMLLIAMISAAVVSTMKGLRLYIILFGKKFDNKKFFFRYMSTSLVNIIVPLKLGELYRGFSMGMLINSFPEGYMAVLLDRFIDTLALVVVSTAVFLFMKIPITFIYGVLTVFLLLVLAAYLCFEPLYKYWNHLLLVRKNSRNTIRALQVLEVLKRAMCHIHEVSSGRFLILFLFSLIAWGIEISVVLLFGQALSSNHIDIYLMDLLSGRLNAYNLLYFISLLAIYGVVFCVLMFWCYVCRKGTNERTCGI